MAFERGTCTSLRFIPQLGFALGVLTYSCKRIAVMFADIPRILGFPGRCPRRPWLILNEHALLSGLGFPGILGPRVPQSKAKESKAKQCKAKQTKQAMQTKMQTKMQNEAKQYEAMQIKARNAKQCNVKQSKAKQSKAKQSKAKQRDRNTC